MLILTRSEAEALVELPAVIDASSVRSNLMGSDWRWERDVFQVAAREGMFHVVSGGLIPHDEREALGGSRRR
jgi:hypothetical protein